MKKVLILIAALLGALMLLPLVAFAQSDVDDNLPFTDVRAGKWYYDNVKFVFKNDIMNGVTGTKFDPNGTLTRGMCATIIYRMAGSPKTEAENKFEDVKAGKYYTKAVAWAQSKGIVNGRTETTFDPEGNITRAEFAVMLYRYLEANMLELPVNNYSNPVDDDLIPSYATEAVAALFRAGVVNGREDGRFDPKAKITRAEAAAMLDRFIKTAEERSITGDDDVLGVAFLGNSMFYVPKIPQHFKAIAKDNHQVEVFDKSRGGWTLANHYEEWNEKDKAMITNLTREWDVIVLNQGRAPDLSLKEEYRHDYEEQKANNPYFKYESFDEFYDDILASQMRDEGNLPTWKSYELLVNLFGTKKRYFNLTNSQTMKREGEGLIRVDRFSDDGLYRHVFIETDPETTIQEWQHSNKAEFMWRDWLRDNCNVHRIMLNLETFDPDNPHDPHEFDLWPNDTVHPNSIYGYCHALALYCTIFDEPAAGQNRGVLTDKDIPGDTPEEKDAYILMLQTMVQEQLDFQNEH